MKATDFVNWIKGFLAGKDQIDGVDLALLNKELEKVSEQTHINLDELKLPDFLPNAPYIEPYIGTGGCKYPGDCGMPTIWHGIVPPVCGKCGFQSGQYTINCSAEVKNVNFDYKTPDTDHITGDLNESHD